MTADTMISTAGLTKDFGRLRAVEGVNVEVRRGEAYGFLGPNGAGKSTTIRMLTGFLRPSSGSIEIMGKDMLRNPLAVKEKVGIVPDQFGFYPLMNSYEHLDFYGRLYGMDRARREARTEEVLRLVGLTDRAKSRVGDYSHGMKQRLAIAQALLNEPEILFLDEPTTGLDPQGQYDTRQLIKKLHSEGLTIFVSSHLLHEVEDICTHVGIVKSGRLVAQDSIANLQGQLSKAKGVLVSVSVCKPGELWPFVKDVPGVLGVEPAGPNAFVVRLDRRDVIPEVARAVALSELGLWNFNEMQTSLEQVFLEMTGGAR
ncbi:MAG: ABC transporter ATP-binding protein [Methanobacteriota archaeon]